MNHTDTGPGSHKTQVFSHHLHSDSLMRTVTIDVFIPVQAPPAAGYRTIYMNDGQDSGALRLKDILERFVSSGKPVIVVAVHTNENRLYEYGTSGIPDYKSRGDKAGAYMQFVTGELLPFIRSHYPSHPDASENYFCGFSLGGLSAIDLVWENPGVFTGAGVFSGSFWWRSKAYEEGYQDDTDRIMHNKIRTAGFKEGLRFWFECGTDDEKDDRNGNGIIDSIDDTLDLISELKHKGYSDKDITYVEIAGGQHNFTTWHHVFPQFLHWATR